MMIASNRTPAAHFNGPTYAPLFDHARLTKQFDRVFAAASDGKWRTLRELADATGDPESSISAQLRHARKPRFGSHTVEKRPRGDRGLGLYEYRLVVNAALRPLGGGA